MITPRYCWNLVLLSLVSFGSHFSISSLSIYGVFLIEAKVISPLGMGFLFAANYVSSLFLPLIIGYLIDSTSQVKTIAITLLVVTTVGQLLLVFALYNNLFVLALVAQALFGSGASSVSAIQRISIAYYLKGNEALTTSVYVSFGSIAKLLGKAIVGPVAVKLGSYQKALLLPALLCAFSLCCYIAFTVTNPAIAENKHVDETIELVSRHDNQQHSGDVEMLASAHHGRKYHQLLNMDESREEGAERAQMSACDTRETLCTDAQHEIDEEANTSSLQRLKSTGSDATMDRPQTSHQLASNPSILVLLRRLPVRFYLFAVVHTVYIMAFHILWNFIPHYVTVRYGIDIVDTGLIAGFPAMLTIVLAPLIGLVVNKFGHSVLVGCIAATLAGLAYVLLLFADVTPVLPIALLSLAQATMPTVLLANITLCVTSGCTGIAFGIVEVLDSVANLFGNSLFGYLYEATGSYTAGLSVLFAFSMLGLFLLLYILVWDMHTLPSTNGDQSGNTCDEEEEIEAARNREADVNSLLVHHGSHKSYHTV